MAEFFGGLTFRNSNHQEWLRHWAEASTCDFITVFQSENVTCILPNSSPPQATPHSPRYSDCKSHPKGPPCRAPHSPDDEVFSKDVSFWRFFTDCQCQYLSTSVNHQTKVLLQSHLLHCRCDLCGTAAFASDEVDLVLAFLRGCVEMLAQVIVQQAIPANPIESTVLKILQKKDIQISISWMLAYQYRVWSGLWKTRAGNWWRMAKWNPSKEKHNSSWHSANSTVFTSIFDNLHNAQRPSCGWCTRPS